MLKRDKEFIAFVIRKYRKKRDLTQAELAELVGISEQHINKLENAKYYPSLPTFLKILLVLQIDINEFNIKEYSKEDYIKVEIINLLYNSTDSENKFYLGLLEKISKTKELLK